MSVHLLRDAQIGARLYCDRCVAVIWRERDGLLAASESDFVASAIAAISAHAHGAAPAAPAPVPAPVPAVAHEPPSPMARFENLELPEPESDR